MIHEIDANLLEYPLDGIVHQANCMMVFGSGIALQIKNKYPEAYKADLQHGRVGDITRLGSFSTVKAHDGKQIYSLYGQYTFGIEKRQTNYEAVYKGLLSIAKHATENNLSTLGCPKLMGCDRGGASWRIVRAIIEDIFIVSPIDFYICEFKG